jgi:FMN phosphatase YigB (HAD superfamily)
VEAAAALFVDDDEGNVAGAIAAGLQGLHFQGYDGLREALAPLL